MTYKTLDIQPEFVCKNCNKKLSKIRHFFKKYPFAVTCEFTDGEIINRELLFCCSSCKIDFVFNKLKNMEKIQ
jgi:hypothetical protein